MQPTQETIQGPEGHSFNAYVSRPAQPNGHAVIVLQEIFGVTRHIREIADRFAQDGYLALAPDLFWRTKPGIELSHSPADIARAMELMKAYCDDDGLADIASTLNHIRALTGFQGKVAVAGLCMGGKLAFLSAAKTSADAAVAFYGVGIEHQLQHAAALQCPVLMHFGDQDTYVPDAARERISEAVGARPGVELRVYPGAGHGFYTRGAEAEIREARMRTNMFLQQALRK